MPRYRRDPEPVAKLFGEAVRAEREEQGLTLEQLGERMGNPDGKYLGELERGFHSPTLTTAKRIADALDVKLTKLVEDL
ncbi:MAG: helix-turn-helix transcriptional regulator [Solirubrobacterales bacterium]